MDYHNRKYYEDDDPEIEDWEYDKLKKEFEELKDFFPGLLSSDTFQDKIGGKSSEKFAPVKHKVRMESLHDSFSIEEIKKFYEKVSGESKERFVVEPKIDGISLSVEYLNGNLFRASTRGDGDIGEDVTENALTIKNLPHTIDTEVKYLEIRGECFMDKINFYDLTKVQEANGDKIFKNPRNAAAGSIRQKNANKCKSRNLKILFFSVQQSDGKNFEYHSQSLEFLKTLGLPVVDSKECKNFEEIVSEIETIGKLRHRYEFQSDGAVVKIDSLALRKSLGSTSIFPRWAEAFKYPPEIKKTICTNIEFSVGRTGIITPICVFNPINLGGSIVSKASLHNEEFAKKKNININDFVYVIKSGDIIPEVFKSEINPDSPEKLIFKMPEICPSCSCKLFIENSDSGRIFRCKNPNCYYKIRSQILHFASRDAMDIENLGEETFNILKNDIKNISDIYRLNENLLCKYKEFRGNKTSINQEMLFGFDSSIHLNKTGKNLIQSILKSKNSSLEKLIYGIGIPFVGKETSKILASHFKNLEKLEKCKKEDLLVIDGVGDVTADSIVRFFENNNNKIIIDNLKKSGVNINYLKSISEKLSGYSFVITGKFERYSRVELTKLIESLGGKVSSSVSKDTSYLLSGENAGKKLENAKQWGVKTIDIKEFTRLIN